MSLCLNILQLIHVEKKKTTTTYKHIILTGAALEVAEHTIAETLKGGCYYPVAFFTGCL